MATLAKMMETATARALRAWRSGRDGPCALADEISQDDADFRMRPGMNALLALLRGRAADPYPSEAEWEAALALAEEEHLLP